jgi:hypothetical protein
MFCATGWCGSQKIRLGRVDTGTLPFRRQDAMKTPLIGAGVVVAVVPLYSPDFEFKSPKWAAERHGWAEPALNRQEGRRKGIHKMKQLTVQQLFHSFSDRSDNQPRAASSPSNTKVSRQLPLTFAAQCPSRSPFNQIHGATRNEPGGKTRASLVFSCFHSAFLLP